MTDVEQLRPVYSTELLFVAVTKRWLLGELSVADRLAYLEWLAARTGSITPDVVAAIQPADDTTLQIVTEAARLSLNNDDNGAATFAVLERSDVFGDLLKLNPSMLEAIRLCRQHT
jgi:hypothetical protein